MGKINPSRALAIFIVLSLFLMVSCFKHQTQNTQTSGVYHLVKKNETVQMIAQAYGVPLQDVAAINNITDVNAVKAGSVIFIPSANRIIDDVRDLANNKDLKETKPIAEAPAVTHKKEVLPATQDQKKPQSKIIIREETTQGKTFPEKKNSEKQAESGAVSQKPGEAIQIDKNRFIWPVRGSVKANFGVQPNKTYNNWIKIVSTTGTRVRAAASGTVIYSSKLKNYGETVIVRHKDHFATVYTHLKKRYVRIDQYVRKGEAIAMLGEKDEAGEAYINFEIRLQGKARNPLIFLP